MRLIVTRPYYDIPTKYISGWAEEIISFAQNKGINVVDLEKEKANKNDFEGRVNKLQPNLVFLNGHGGADFICGQDDRVLVKAGENHDVLKGKITYALSCESGKKLGPEVVKDEKSTYIGYSDEFVFVCDMRYKGKPLTDIKARPFMEASNLVMLSLLKGNSAKEASDKSKIKFREHVTKLSSSAADPDILQAMQFLWWNAEHQVCLGDQNAKL